VNNRGESERFLYYDGPTNLNPPFQLFLQGDILQALANKQEDQDHRVLGNAGGVSDTPSAPKTFIDHDGWSGLFIRVNGREITGQPLNRPLGTGPTLNGDEVEKALVDIIEQRAPWGEKTPRGLTDSEAAGFMDCWRTDFFKEGQRVLLFFNQATYDQFCPMVVRPKPTELVRVGIILTEFKQ
jgi:hypothetical protein